MTTKIVLCEPIHPVIQGEGVHTGEKMIVVRVAGCSVRCPDCDSKHAWENIEYKEEYELKEFYKIIKKNLKKYKCNHVLLTGGEPGLYLTFLETFFSEYQEELECMWDIETAGVHDWSILYDWEEYIQFNFSPKIGALIPLDKDIVGTSCLKSLPVYYSVKVVTSKATFDKDIEMIKTLVDMYNIPSNNVYLMPMGTTKKEILKESKWLMKKIFRTPYSYSHRVHILIYNSKRMV